VRGTSAANCNFSVWAPCYALVVITTNNAIYIRFRGSPTVEVKYSHAARHTKPWILTHLNKVTFITEPTLAKNCLAKSWNRVIWHVNYQNKEKATSAIFFVKYEPWKTIKIEFALTHNAKLSGKMQLAKMCSEAKRSQLSFFRLSALLYAALVKLDAARIYAHR